MVRQTDAVAEPHKTVYKRLATRQQPSQGGKNVRKLNSMEDFKRDISYRLRVRENESISLIGTLRDCFHDIDMEIVVDGSSLIITDSRVTFHTAPSPHCEKVQNRLGLLNGVKIGKGLTRKLNAALGGSDGCGNLRTLLTGLLPLALNVKASAGVSDEKEVLDAIHFHLQGTCVGYPVEEKNVVD